MDLITIDVSNIEDKDLYLGKAVEILGDNQSCEDLAIQTGTNEHEILISLGMNSKKVYI
jgi:alanine racemase